MKNLILAIPLFALLISCNQSNKSENVTGFTADTVQYYYKTLRKESKNIIDRDSTKDTTSISIVYPVFQDADLNKFVDTTLARSDNPDEEAANINQVADNFINAFDVFFKKNKTFPRMWESKTELKVVRQSKDLVQFEDNYSSYTGGAHGIEGTNYYNFSRPENKRLLLIDVIKEDSLEKFTAVAEKIFRENEKISSDEMLSKNYFFDGGKFSLNNNFLLNKNEIVFLYNAYEIKPYVFGITTLSVPYTAVSTLVKSKYIPKN